MTTNQQKEPIQSKIDFLNEAFIRNPHPIYAEVREKEPVSRFLLPSGHYAWIVTTYEDVAAVLNDSRFVTSHPVEEGVEQRKLPSHVEIISRNLSNVNASDHRRLRRLVQKAFTPRMVEELRGRIVELTNALLDQVQAKGEMNLIQDFAFPLPIKVICEMLGVPVEDQDKFSDWSGAIMEGFNNPMLAERSEQALIAFIDYLQQLIAKRRSDLKQDLISDLIRVEEDGDMLSEHELYAMIFVLIIAGHETTVNLIGNGVLSLLEHPEQLEMLKNEPGLIHSAIEEILRYESPVEVNNMRWATEDVELQGKQIRKGEMVFVVLSSANRDGSHFTDPTTFDITRKANDHLAFGKGIHFCMGAPLARLEGEIAISTLLRRMPALSLQTNRESLDWRHGIIIRGLKEIPLVF